MEETIKEVRLLASHGVKLGIPLWMLVFVGVGDGTERSYLCMN